MKRIVTTLTIAAAIAFTPAMLAQTTDQDLLFLKQEEKVARDVYQALYDLWGHQTFANIARSEQSHMYAMDRVLAYNGLTDTTPDERGRFSIPELQALHDELILMGSSSLEEALAVGILIEETDIADIDALLATLDDATTQRILSRLRFASTNHLSAFTRALEQLNSDTAVCEPIATRPPAPTEPPRAQRRRR